MSYPVIAGPPAKNLRAERVAATLLGDKALAGPVGTALAQLFCAVDDQLQRPREFRAQDVENVRIGAKPSLQGPGFDQRVHIPLVVNGADATPLVLDEASALQLAETILELLTVPAWAVEVTLGNGEALRLPEAGNEANARAQMLPGARLQCQYSTAWRTVETASSQ